MTSPIEKTKLVKVQLEKSLVKVFPKIQNNNYSSVKELKRSIGKVLNNTKVVCDVLTKQNGEDFYFLHLKTTVDETGFHFYEELFSRIKNYLHLSNDMVYTSVFISSVVLYHVEKVLELMDAQMATYKLIPLRWTLEDQNMGKKIYIRIPRGEFFYFSKKAQHLIPLSKEWFQCVLEPPKMYYNLWGNTYHLSKDMKTMFHRNNCYDVVIRKKKLLKCFKLIVLLCFIDKFESKIHRMSANTNKIWFESAGTDEHIFWYFENRSSSYWAMQEARIQQRS